MFKSKYIKYKTKYLNLKMKRINKDVIKSIIIHIAGASGAGKTYLGNRLAKDLGDKVIVKDLDDLREEHFVINEQTDISFEKFYQNYRSSYQKFIDNFIQKNNSKPIIFVGINTYILGETFHFKEIEGKYPKIIFNVHADYQFYIDIDSDIILKQRFDREFVNYIDWFCDWIKNRQDILFNNLLNDETQAKNDICVALTKIMNFSKIREDINQWNDFYRKQRYIFLSTNDIYQRVLDIFVKN